MDNDFNKPAQRPYTQPLRPLQPAPPRTINGMRPMQGQHRPITQPYQKPSAPPLPNQNAPKIAPLQPQTPKPPVSNFVPLQVEHKPPTPQQTVPQSTSLNFEPPKKKKKPRRIKKFFTTVLPILIIIAGIIWVVLYITNTQKTIADQDTQIDTLKAQLRSAEQTNKDLNRQIATLPGITLGLTQAEQNNVTAAISSGNYAAIKPFLIQNTLVILAASDGIGRRTPEQAIKDLNYLKDAAQPWDFALSNETLENYRDGDYAQYFPEGAIIGKSADGKVVSLSTTTTGQISVIFMAPSESLL